MHLLLTLLFAAASLKRTQGISWFSAATSTETSGVWRGSGSNCGDVNHCNSGETEWIRGTNGNGGGTGGFCSFGFKSYCKNSASPWCQYIWVGTAPICPGSNRCNACPTGGGWICLAKDSGGDGSKCNSGKKAFCGKRCGRRRMMREITDLDLVESPNLNERFKEQQAQEAKNPQQRRLQTDDGDIACSEHVIIGVIEAGSLNSPFESNHPCFDGATTDPASTAPESEGPLGRVGLRPRAAPWAGSTEPGCFCEGYGAYGQIGSGGPSVAADVSVGGFQGGTVTQFTVNRPGQIISKVTSLDGSLEIEHDYHPFAANEHAMECTVTLKNIGAVDFDDMRYRRAMDWDIFPDYFNEFVTIQGTGTTVNLVASSDNGFVNPNIQLFPSLGTSCGGAATVNQDIVDNGPCDHGAAFDFSFGPLVAGAEVVFRIFYGVETNEALALGLIGDIQAELYSFGQQSGDGPGGTPFTFVFAFSGVGGVALETANPTLSPTGRPTVNPTESPQPLEKVNFGVVFTCGIDEDFVLTEDRELNFIQRVAERIGLADPQLLAIVAEGPLDAENSTGAYPDQDHGFVCEAWFDDEEAANIAIEITQEASFSSEVFDSLNPDIWPPCAGDVIDSHAEPVPAPGDDRITRPPSKDAAALTYNPTYEPTPSPTDEPTQDPTSDPTEEPTEDPSISPTRNPTPAPTLCTNAYVAITSRFCDSSDSSKKKKKGSSRRLMFWRSEQCGVLDISRTDPIVKTRRGKTKIKQGRTIRAMLDINSCCSDWAAGRVYFRKDKVTKDLTVRIDLRGYIADEVRIGYRDSEAEGDDDEFTQHWFHETGDDYLTYTFDDEEARNSDQAAVLIRVCPAPTSGSSDSLHSEPIVTNNTLSFNQFSAGQGYQLHFMAVVLCVLRFLF